MENKKTFVIKTIFIILFVFFLGYSVYSFSINRQLNNNYLEAMNKYETVKEKLKKDKNANIDKNYITVSDIGNKTYGYSYNYYAHGYPAIVVGYNGDLYEIESTSDSFRSCITDLVETNKVNFKDGVYKCESTSGINDNPYIKQLNIKESDVSKVVISHNPGSSDISYITFFIYTNGEVKYNLNSGELKEFKKLVNYDIKDITHFYCGRGSYNTCGGGYKIDVILRDNKIKSIKLEKSDL